MMTPKEKAKELFRKVYFLDSKIWQDTAKEITLIMVNEIINNASKYDMLELTDVKYWNEVKEEIKLMML